MEERKIIAKTAGHVEHLSRGEGSGHDWWHINRVWSLSKQIAKKEGGDRFVIEMAALLHDLDDWKFSSKGPTYRARKLMKAFKVDEKRIGEICYIIDNVGFRGGFGAKMKSLEGMIVQDADRIDALGAIGIARVFAYSGYKGRVIHDPGIKPVAYKNESEYKRLSKKSTAVNHFYEKLFKLENRINTRTGKRLAAIRTQYMKDYMKRFMAEWEGVQ